MKKMLLAPALSLSIPFSFYAALVPIDRTESAISAFFELSNTSTTPRPDSNKSSSVSADLLSSDWETIGNPEVRLIKIRHLIKESLNTLKNPLVDEYALQTVLESWSFFTLLSTSDLSVETLVEASLNDTKYSLQDLKKIHYSLGFENTGPITPQQINSKFKEMKDAFMLLKNNQVATAEEKRQAINLLKERVLVLYPFLTKTVKLSIADSLGINQLSEPSKEEIKKFISEIEPVYQVAKSFYLSARGEIFLDFYKMYCAGEKDLCTETINEYRRLLKKAFFMDDNALFKVTEALKSRGREIIHSASQLTDVELDARRILRDRM